jgi:hypothetical protein
MPTIGPVGHRSVARATEESRPRGKKRHEPDRTHPHTLVVVGVLLWLLNNYVPMDAKIKRIINAIVVIGTDSTVGTT